ncbi:MAG: Eco57I restriction-modification methylase domain-containing protein [Oscillospiraceae bacterium]
MFTSFQDKGRLAYIIPSEFMNSKYGTAIKQLLINKKLLRAIINFKNDNEMFFNATTTCCLILLDHEEKEQVCFYNLQSVDDLTLNILEEGNSRVSRVGYDQLTASRKVAFVYQPGATSLLLITWCLSHIFAGYREVLPRVQMIFLFYTRKSESKRNTGAVSFKMYLPLCRCEDAGFYFRGL